MLAFCILAPLGLVGRLPRQHFWEDKRDIAIIDIPRAFLQTYIDEIVHAVMREKLVGTLLAVNKEKSPNLLTMVY